MTPAAGPGPAPQPVILIAAMTRDRVIGRGRGLPWKIPEEYEHFLRHVRGNTVVIGRTSHEIFGPDLGECRVIVVSSRPVPLEGVESGASVADALRRAQAYGRPVFVAGGASIYRQTLPLADALYLSFVKRDHDGDARFPEFDESEWEVRRREDHARYEFRVYERRVGAA